MTFEGNNLYGHVYNHNEVFAASKKKKWRPKHHELAFGKASSRPPWYRNVKYGMQSELPPAIASKRFDAHVDEAASDTSGSWASGQIRAYNEKLLHHVTGESQLEMSHSSNLIAGGPGRLNEERAVGAWNNFNQDQHAFGVHTRFANAAIHEGNEGAALVHRETTNSTLQPLYPMSVVNDSFNRHLIAKATADAHKPKPEHDRTGPDRHPTQVMYLPYARTRRDFPAANGGKMETLAKQIGPGWWPGREGGGGGGVPKHGDVIAPNGYEPRGSTPPGFMHDSKTGEAIHRPQAPYW